jgi:predicted RNA-binding Zn ribbon-like protein
MLSDHPVLEFLNTTPMVEGKLQDLLQTDADVLSTLARLGWSMKFKGTTLLTAARELREELRQLVESRKAGEPLNLAQLNKFLAEAKSHLKLRQDREGSLAVDRVWEHRTPQQALAPVAEAAAKLLATGDFELVRRCESETCVLWFYDRTKSHHRRWCSMASCGNRHKVAAFRKRRSDA